MRYERNVTWHEMSTDFLCRPHPLSSGYHGDSDRGRDVLVTVVTGKLSSVLSVLSPVCHVTLLSLSPVSDTWKVLPSLVGRCDLICVPYLSRPTNCLTSVYPRVTSLLPWIRAISC